MKSRLILLLSLALTPFLVWAGERIVSQHDKAFSVVSLKVKVGETVVFRNDDPFVHNIFSLSEIQSFDLGTYRQGESRRVKMLRPGRIEVECAVHPQMKMVIEVTQ